MRPVIVCEECGTVCESCAALRRENRRLKAWLRWICAWGTDMQVTNGAIDALAGKTAPRKGRKP